LGGWPTTRALIGGPDPSAAGCATKPATSLPGFSPGLGFSSKNVSPRFGANASTLINASSGAGTG
jgi:hypothetical protein